MSDKVASTPIFFVFQIVLFDRGWHSTAFAFPQAELFELVYKYAKFGRVW